MCPLTVEERIQSLEDEIVRLRRENWVFQYSLCGLVGIVLIGAVVTSNSLSARADEHDHSIASLNSTTLNHKDRILDLAHQIGLLRVAVR